MVQLRLSLAISLVKDQQISVSLAAKMAGEPVGLMLTRLAWLRVPVVDYDEQALIEEVAVAAAWTNCRRWQQQ